MPLHRNPSRELQSFKRLKPSKPVAVYIVCAAMLAALVLISWLGR